MYPKKSETTRRLALAGAASAFLVTGIAAHAEMAAFSLPAMPAAAPVSASQAVAAAAPAGVAPAQQAPADTAKPAAMPPAAPIACTAPSEFAHFTRPLLHTARRLASGEPLTVVAIGSSSTAGAGASAPAASYPSRLAVDLQQRFATPNITVLNRGVNGEETEDTMARFDTAVIAEHPQLVLWQVGTNSVLRDHPLKEHAVELREGIDELKAIGTDVLLIDPQYAPKVLAKSETPGMVEQIAAEAKQENVDLFQRFAVMRDWYEVQHLSFDVFVSPDGLHMNDWGYACWATILANGIAEAATRPIASAAAHARR